LFQFLALLQLIERWLSSRRDELLGLFAAPLERFASRTDQLLNVVYLLTREQPTMKKMSEEDRLRLLDQLLKYLNSAEDS